MTDLTFSKALNQWYEQEKRDLPWRNSFSPYTIWISEIMLQQTQVITVIDYYNRFIGQFPTLKDLASADEATVFKLWEGLGYYSRARNLIRCANVIQNDFAGVFPSDLNTLKKLPGIGPYTAGAIKSIAFNQKAPAVDGNVMRVISRFQGLKHDISVSKNRVSFEEAVMELMGGEPRTFNQALMELGARVCTPKQPNCEACPVKNGCVAFKEGNPTDYPVKLKKIKKSRHSIAVILVEKDNKFLIYKRPSGSLMGDLWGFPTVDVSVSNLSPEQWMLEEFGIKVTLNRVDQGARHIFTHLIWDMKLYRCFYSSGSTNIESPEVLWVERSELDLYAFPTAFKKLFKNI